MQLELLDAEHGHDQDGTLWVRDPVRWRRATDPEPCEDAPSLLLQGAFGGWTPPGPHDDVQFLFSRDLPEIEVNGRRWRRPWRLLVETPSGRRYAEFSF